MTQTTKGMERRRVPIQQNDYSGRMKIFVKTLTGETLELDVFPWSTIEKVKLDIEESTGTPVD